MLFRSHPSGDFSLGGDDVLQPAAAGGATCTYAGIGVYSPRLFSGMAGGFMPLRPLLMAAMLTRGLRGELFHGEWHDIGTPQRLAEINAGA